MKLDQHFTPTWAADDVECGRCGRADQIEAVARRRASDQLGECCCGETAQAWRLCPQHGPGTEHDLERTQAMPQHYDDAVALVRRQGRATPPLLQRHLRVAYSTALHLMDHMEAQGVVSAPDDRAAARC